MADYTSKNGNTYFVKSMGKFQRVTRISNYSTTRTADEALLAQYHDLYFFGSMYPHDSIPSDSVVSAYSTGLFFKGFDNKFYEVGGVFDLEIDVNPQLSLDPLLGMADTIGLKDYPPSEMLFINAAIEPTKIPKYSQGKHN